MREKSCFSFIYCKIHWIFTLFFVVMELNIRPGTSDVGYAKRVVKTLTLKGIVGVFIVALPLLLWIWTDFELEQFYVTRDSTPKVWAVSLAIILQTGNGYAMHSRATAYSLFTRCVWRTPVHLGNLLQDKCKCMFSSCLVQFIFVFIQFGRFATTSEPGLCNDDVEFSSDSFQFCINFATPF
jgi:hypothetical protein